MSDIFERTRKRVEAGKDFDPDMVYELCVAYDSKISYLADALKEIAAEDEKDYPFGYRDFARALPLVMTIAKQALKETE